MNRCDRDNRSKRLAFLAYFFLLLTLFFPSISKAAEDRLLIAAAASLRYPLDAIAIAFQTEQSVSVKISYGASGSLFAQLKQGAPFDLFLSADHLYSKMLMEDQLASDYFEFGLGRIVLWVPKKSTIDISKEGVNGLLHASTRKIAIANPAYAPYGAAAISALKRFGLYQEIKGKLVFGEDIAQAAHFVESGAAEIGILAYSIVAQKQIKGEGGDYWLIPLDAHLPLKQTGVILNRSKEKGLAKKFVQFITTGKGKIILQRWLTP